MQTVGNVIFLHKRFSILSSLFSRKLAFSHYAGYFINAVICKCTLIAEYVHLKVTKTE